MVGLGAAVRAEREKLRLSQSELGDMVGASRQAIAALEQSRGRVATLLEVEPILGLHLGGLAHGNGIIERVRASRALSGRSLREVAASAGLSINTVREVENGRGAVFSLVSVIEALSRKAVFSAGASRLNKTGFPTVGRRLGSSTNASEYYPTPAPVTRLLLDHEHFDPEHPILEPAVGKARAIDRVLRDRGYRTVCFDLFGEGAEQQDFLRFTGRCHSLITNPPFSAHREFITKAKEVVDDKFALLLPLNFLTGARRHADIWNDNVFPLARVHVLNRGVNFLKSEPHGDKFESAQIYVGWFVFERSHIGQPHINWIDCGPWIARTSQPKMRANAAE